MTTQDITAGPLRVSGLRQAAENLAALSSTSQTKIVRPGLFAGLSGIVETAREKTYTSFLKRSGAIGKGWGRAVWREFKGTTLAGVVTQDPQSLAGSTTAARLFRKSFSLKGRRKRGQGKAVALQQFAFWWRFLEYGTGPRKGARKPKWVGRRAARTGREAAAAARYAASGNRGAIKARPWVEPSLASSGGTAIARFDRVLRQSLDAEISKLPK